MSGAGDAADGTTTGERAPAREHFSLLIERLRDDPAGLAAALGIDLGAAEDMLTQLRRGQQYDEDLPVERRYTPCLGVIPDGAGNVSYRLMWQSPPMLESAKGETVVLPTPGHEHVTVGAVVGTGESEHRDGGADEAAFGGMRGGFGSRGIRCMLRLPGGRVVVADGHYLRLLSADLATVTTLAGDSEGGHVDGAVAQARFNDPSGLALLPDGRVLVAESSRIRALSADLQQVSTVMDGDPGPWEGDPEERDSDEAAARYHRDGPAGVARFGGHQTALMVLPSGQVLLATSYMRFTGPGCLRLLSADLQHMTTVIRGERGRLFWSPADLVLLPDGLVLVSDEVNNRVVGIELGGSSLFMVAGDDPRDRPEGWQGGHRDGAKQQAQFAEVLGMLALPDGRVLVSEIDEMVFERDASDVPLRIRVLSADMEQVSTLTIAGLQGEDPLESPRAAAERRQVPGFSCFELLPDGRVLMAHGFQISVLEGLMALGPKPAAKPPKKRALAGGASSSSSSSSSSSNGGGGSGCGSPGPALKRGCSGAGPHTESLI